MVVILFYIEYNVCLSFWYSHNESKYNFLTIVENYNTFLAVTV